MKCIVIDITINISTNYGIKLKPKYTFNQTRIFGINFPLKDVWQYSNIKS